MGARERLPDARLRRDTGDVHGGEAFFSSHTRTWSDTTVDDFSTRSISPMTLRSIAVRNPNSLEPKLAGRSLVPSTQRSYTTDSALF